jgi:hypothetical protein
MRPITTKVLLALVGSIALAPAYATADAPQKPEAQPADKLVGTWKRVSAKYDGKDAPLPAGFTQLKHVTPTQFMWVVYGEDGKVVAGLGGTYTSKGDEYVETPEYGVEEATLGQLKGKPQVFRWKVAGNKWHHTGKLSSGVSIEEVWERVEKK